MVAGLVVISILSALAACAFALPLGIGPLWVVLGFGCGAPVLIVGVKFIQYSLTSAEAEVDKGFLGAE